MTRQKLEAALTEIRLPRSAKTWGITGLMLFCTTICADLGYTGCPCEDFIMNQHNKVIILCGTAYTII